MYTDFFGLAEMPFMITPDPRFLWYSEQHQEAKNKIVYHILSSAGPIYLLADIGTGKTTLARRIMTELEHDEKQQVVFVFAPKLPTTNAFLRFVMDEFGVKTDRSYSRSLKNFEEFLKEQYKAGISPVLLIDEAQNMTRDMLLLVQHLFNFSTNTEFLIQMVMFAQPELQPKLERLSSLKSRLNLAKLKPLNADQTKAMMQFRWTVAGGKKLPFNDDAVSEIYRVTQGVPRSIVKLANEALIKTVAENQHTVTKDAVFAATADLAVGQL
ncbi:MAG: AAA family ATPase [Anaerolineae bacterium]|nr:AAA family ATPase [Anaerolineae bacterium]